MRVATPYLSRTTHIPTSQYLPMRATAERGACTMPCRTIAVTNQKGSTGKTATTLS